MSDENATRFPPARNANGKWISILKIILESRIGGWIIACVVFAVMARWVISDREAVYVQLSNLREVALERITETRDVAKQNQKTLEKIVWKLYGEKEEQ